MSKILIFGSSFVGPFNLINDKNVKVYKFKGGTLKGLTKSDNENREKIINIVRNNEGDIKAILFMFGEVDIHFSYYYNALNNNLQDNKKILTDYIKFLNYIQKIANSKIIIVNPVRNPIGTSLFINIKQLLNYRIIDISELNINRIKEIDSLIKKKEKYYFNYINILKLATKKSNNSELIYLNLNKYLLNDKNEILNKYKDISSLNIHLLYKPILELYLFHIFQKILNIKYTKSQINKFFINENKYLHQKQKQINIVINKEFIIENNQPIFLNIPNYKYLDEVIQKYENKTLKHIDMDKLILYKKNAEYNTTYTKKKINTTKTKTKKHITKKK